ncbi:MAG: hypothetical protein WBY44_37150 [Bryobacteraceae bacterium]
MIAVRGFKLVCYIAVALLVTAVIAPYIAADEYGERLRASLERSLGRRVDLKAKLTFSLLHGPAFRVDGNGGSGVIIHEDPAIGAEPIAYVGALEVRPNLWRLLFGKFVISSIRLEDASINLAKSGPASEWGRWNFASVVNPSMMRVLPALQVRNGRINFKFGNDKTTFYLTETDLDISPPVAIGRGWKVDCSAQLARTDRPATGLGAFRLEGRWYVEPERVDLNLAVSDAGLGELTELMRGEPGGIHGDVSAQLHLAGPVNGIGIRGRLNITDVHRWDLLPTKGNGLPLDIRGRLDLIKQQLYLESNSARDVPLPLSVRLRVSDYLSQPHWAVGINWNHFPTGPLMQLARDMGSQFPPKLQLSGTVDGAIGYSGQGSFQGTLGFHDAAVTIPDSPPVRFENAYLVTDHGHVRLSPASVLSTAGERATLEADYAIDAETLDLAIVTDSMNVAALRSQVALAAVPWLERLQSGVWSGHLNYHLEPKKSAWSGDLQVTDAKIAVPGLADPLVLTAAHARIDGPRLALDRIEAQAGKMAFSGDYQYEPDAARPHRLHLRADSLDAADLEAEFRPTLRRDGNLLARALGRSTLPDWLKQRGVEGTIAVNHLDLAAVRVDNIKAHLAWDVSRIDLDNLQAMLDGAPLTGRLAVNLRGSRPAYKLVARVKGWDWQSGRLDAQVTADTAGMGPQLLTNLQAAGSVSGAALDFGTALPWRCVSGAFNLVWAGAAPRVRFTALSLRTGDDIYTGQGGTQDGGRMLLTLTNGPKELHISGMPGALKVEDLAAR